MNLYFHNDYPKTLVKTLRKLHSLPGADPKFRIIHREAGLEDYDKSNTVIFLIDSNLKGVSVPVKKHLENGYKIFAFRDTEENVNLFRLIITILSYWKKILNEIKELDTPFLKTFSYKSRGFRSVKL